MSREALPPWAAQAVRQLERARKGEHVSYYVLAGRSAWRFLRSKLFLVAPPQKPGSWALVPLWPIGVAFLAWAVLSLRWFDYSAWRWGVGAALVLIGSIGLTVRTVRKDTPAHEGFLFVTDGVIELANGMYRVAARTDIQRFVGSDGSSVAVIGAEQRQWCLFSAQPGSQEALHIGALHRGATSWLQEGTYPRLDDPANSIQARAGGAGCNYLIYLIGAAAPCGLVYATLVLPATSDASQAAQHFLSLVREGDYEAAHAMCSPERQANVSRSKLKRELPPELAQSSGFSVNSISGGLGTSKGTTGCVEGRLDGVDGHSGFSIHMVVVEDEWRVDKWTGACPRPGR